MSRWKLVLFALGSIPLLALAAGIEYYLPSTTLVQVTGTEVKRMDADGDSATPLTRDVRFVYARELDSGRTREFRNEDTRWGWPPYFKFDSGTIASQAANFVQSDPRPTVLVTYYGWRMNMLDLYPNVVGLRTVPPGYRHIPVFNILVLGLLAAAIGWIAWGIRRRRGRRRIRSAPLR